MKRFFISTLLAIMIVFASVPVITFAQIIIPTVDTSGSATYNSYPTQVQNNTVSQSNTSSSGFSECKQIATKGIPAMVDCAISFFNSFVYIIMSLSVVYIVLGAFKMIQSEEGRDGAKATITYGIIGLFVMISIWGLVNILDNTFKLSGQDARSAPQLIPKR